MRWITSTIVEQLTAIGTTVLVDALGALTLAEKQEIAKVITVHLYFRASAHADGSHVHGRAGLIIANDDAISTGAGALPSPIQDSDQSWMHNWFFTTERQANPFEERLQLKAQRLIKPGTSLAFILQSDSASDSAVHWSAGMRILIAHK